VLTAETPRTISELKISLLVLLLSMDMISNHYRVKMTLSKTQIYVA